MVAWAGPVRLLASESWDAGTLVSASLLYTVSMTEPQANTLWPRLDTVRAGPWLTAVWKLTVPAVPAATAPRSTLTTPLPAEISVPASSPEPSVKGSPFHRMVPGRYTVPAGTVSWIWSVEVVPLPRTL